MEVLRDAGLLGVLGRVGLHVDSTGHLIDIDGRPFKTTRSRRSRHLFTDEDDRILARWMENVEAQGLRVTTRIFQELESIAPQHPSATWRTRWYREVSKNPPPPRETSHVEESGLVEDEEERKVLEDGMGGRLEDDHTDTDKNEMDLPNADTEVDIDIDIDTEIDAEINTDENEVKASHTHTHTDKNPVETSYINASLLPDPNEAVSSFTEPEGRVTANELSTVSTKTLRQALGVSDNRDLARWLSQPWVIKNVHGYLTAVVDPPEKHRYQARTHSTKLYLVNAAIAAIRDANPRYVHVEASERALWSLDDHDVRFMVQLVTDGRRPGRWWEYQPDLPTLLATSYRLMCWIRRVYSAVASSDLQARWIKADAGRWRVFLDQERTSTPAPTLHHVKVEPLAVTDQNDNDMTDQNDNDMTDLNDNDMTDQNGNTAPGGAPSMIPLPIYPVRQSKQFPGQIQGLQWMTLEGQDRFQRQQAVMLARWGVTPQYEDSCILVPWIWDKLDPTALLDTSEPFHPPPDGQSRLLYSMGDHSAPWARASAWFDHRRFPRTGVEFDSLLSTGVYIPMDGSHLCHQGYCITPLHIVYERADVNSEREGCRTLAADLRRHGHVREHCLKHHPPCRLTLAAMTPSEHFLVQLSVLRHARGRDPAPPAPRPDHHPFPTFEDRLPLSFAEVQRLPDRERLAYMQPNVPADKKSLPIFYCPFCRKVSTFRTIVGYWTHLRDSHPLDSQSARLLEVKRAGLIWRQHLESGQTPGQAPPCNDRLWAYLQQVSSDKFGWHTVTTWKLLKKR